MGRCRPSLSQIVGGHTDDDTRRCGGPTGLKRRQPRDASPVTVVRAPAKYLARSKRELAAKKAADSRRKREQQKRKRKRTLTSIGWYDPKWHDEFVKKEDSD